MIYRELGKSGMKVSAVGLGTTWAIGGTWWGGTDEASSIAAIQTGLDAGINLIDTAPAYGYGLAEEIVGRAIRGRNRDGIVIATKAGLVWDSEGGTFFFEVAGKRVHRNLRAASIRREIEESLTRLGTDRIDLYQTHWQDPTTPIQETMGELLKLKEEGKIRAIGVSNANISHMRQYLDCGRIESNQPLYNMLDRSIEDEELPFCREHDIGVLSYSSLALGLLTGKMDADRKFPNGDGRATNPRFAHEPVVRINQMLERFAPIREKYGLNQTQLTIAWTISRPGLTSALVGVRNAEQAADTAPGGGAVLSPDDLAEMDRTIDAVGAL